MPTYINREISWVLTMITYLDILVTHKIEVTLCFVWMKWTGHLFWRPCMVQEDGRNIELQKDQLVLLLVVWQALLQQLNKLGICYVICKASSIKPFEVVQHLLQNLMTLRRENPGTQATA